MTKSIKNNRGLLEGTSRALTRTAVLTTGLALCVTSAGATPPSGFYPTGVALGSYSQIDVSPSDRTGAWRLLAKADDPTDIGVDDVVLDAGGSTGWHSHDGAVFETVKSGSIKVYHAADCSFTTYTVGQSYYAAAHEVHDVRSSSGGEFVAVQIRPHGAPPVEDQPAPSKCN